MHSQYGPYTTLRIVKQHDTTPTQNPFARLLAARRRPFPSERHLSKAPGGSKGLGFQGSGVLEGITAWDPFLGSLYVYIYIYTYRAAPSKEGRRDANLVDYPYVSVYVCVCVCFLDVCSMDAFVSRALRGLHLQYSILVKPCTLNPKPLSGSQGGGIEALNEDDLGEGCMPRTAEGPGELP